MYNNYFNNRLRELRKEKNLTQAQVAKALGLKLNTYSHMELDGKRPSLDILQKISKLFFVSIESLTGDKPKNRPPYVIHETPPLVFHDHLGDYEERLGKRKPEPQMLRDLRTVEQDMILYFRSLPEGDQAKVVKYVERTFKKNLENEEK